MDRTRLTFRSASEIVGSPHIGLLLLTDSAEQRQVAVPCGKRVKDEFAMRSDEDPAVARTIIDTLWNVVRWQTDLRLEIHIDHLADGKYVATLCNLDTLEELPMAASDAVLLSFVSDGAVPIFMENGLFMRQSTVFEPEGVGVSLPVNTITDEMLSSALDKAIESENYEMASSLRDEIARRREIAARQEPQADTADGGEATTKEDV